METSNVGSVVEFSPATREARVRFPDVAFFFIIVFIFQKKSKYFIFKTFILNNYLDIMWITVKIVCFYNKKTSICWERIIGWICLIQFLNHMKWFIFKSNILQLFYLDFSISLKTKGCIFARRGVKFYTSGRKFFHRKNLMPRCS